MMCHLETRQIYKNTSPQTFDHTPSQGGYKDDINVFLQAFYYH